MTKRKTSYEQLQILLKNFNKEKITGLEKCQKFSTYDEFLSSEFNQVFNEFLQQIIETKIPEETKSFFWQINDYYKKIYEIALTISSENLEESSENYIKINKKKIKIPLENWNKVFACLIRIPNYDKEFLHNMKTKNLNFRQLLRNAIKDLLVNEDKLINEMCKPENVSEKVFEQNLINKNLSVPKDYIIEKSYFLLLIKIFKNFINIPNIVINDSNVINKNENLDYIINQIFTVYIICLEKQKNIENSETNNITIPLLNLQEKLGSSIIDLISFFIKGTPNFIFDWKNKNFHEIIAEIAQIDSLNSQNPKLCEKQKILIKKLMPKIEIDILDNKFSQIILQTILLKTYQYVETEYASFMYEKESKWKPQQKRLYETRKILLDKGLVNKVEYSLTQKKIKIGANLLNYMRQKLPQFIGNTKKFMLGKKKFPIFGVEITNCFEILDDICRLNRPFLVSNLILDKTNLSFRYNQAYLQRILNFVHNNKNGYLKIKENLIQITKNYVDKSALLIFLFALLKEFETYDENFTDIFEINEILEKIPLLLSLYYLKSDEILMIYSNTNVEGKTIIKNLIKLMITFEHQTEIEKNIVKSFLNTEQLIENKDVIKDLFNKIIGIKYSFLLSIRESILFSNFGFFYIPFFFDSRGRHYYNNKGLHLQSHYMIRGIVKIYNNNTTIESQKVLRKIKETLIETATNDINSLFNYKKSDIKSLHLWINKYSLKKNDELNFYENKQLELLKSQFLSSFVNLDLDSFNALIDPNNALPVNTISTFMVSISTIIRFFCNYIKSIKKLTLKIIEFFSFMENNIFGKPDYIIEYDAVSNGLQMQSITLKSESLGKSSKLIESDEIDTYAKGATNFAFCMESKIKILSESCDLPSINFNELNDENKNWLQFCMDMKKKFDLLKKSQEPLDESFFEKELKVFKELIFIIKKKSKHLNDCIKIITYFVDNEKDFGNENSTILFVFQNFLNNQKNNSEIYKLILNTSLDMPFLISLKDFCYILNLLSEIQKKIIYQNHIKKPIEQILESDQEINFSSEDQNIMWFIDSYRTKCKSICETLNIPNISLISNTHIFKIRVILLNFHNVEGDFILKLTNKRELWKHLVMTYSYNSTSYGRITANYKFIKNIMINMNKQMLREWSYLYEDFFSQYFQPVHLGDTKIFKEISKEISTFVKNTNKPIILENQYVIFTMNPKKYISARLPINSYKKELRGYMLTYNFPLFDENTNSFLLDYKKINNMFGPTYCHMLDAYIVITLLRFVNNLNKNMKKKNISYNFSLEPNHDSFRSPNIYFLEMIIEFGYIYLIETNYFDSMFKDMPFYKELVKIIQEKITKEQQDIYTKTIVKLGKGFVKF